MKLLSFPFLLSVCSFVQAQATPCLAEFNTPVFDDRVSMGGPMVGIRTQSVNLMVVGRLELFTGEASGANKIELWSHDAGLNQPLASLGSATWSMGRANGWQGANFVPPILIQASTTFWVVWTPAANAQASVERAVGAGQVYRPSFDGGQSWTGPYQDHEWKFRLFCGAGFAHYEVFGAGCPGSQRTSPTLAFTGVPALGQPFSLLLERALPTAPVVAVLGFSSSTWLGLGLPLDLTPLGAPGCTLLASGHLLLPVLTTAAGTAAQQFTVPGDASLAGAPVFNQWWGVDQAANPLNLTFSNGGKGTLGN